jgi:hypothetical protein
VGLWSSVELGAALQVLITLITIFILLYEKQFFKNRCVNCRFYQHYIHEKKSDEKQGDEKQ